MSVYTPHGASPVINSAMARIERHLPEPGDVLVRVGQRVEPEDVVARAYRSSPPQIINVARSLGIQPSQVERAMVREVGNTVAQGEVLARSSRIGGRSCIASVGGVIAAVDSETGYVTVAPDRQQFDLLANVRGVVMDVQPYEAVLIETLAAQVYGAWGMGSERNGVLRLLVTDAAEPIDPAQIDARSAYAILIGGSGISAAALRRATQEQVRGVIVGSIDERELRAFLGWASSGAWRIGVSTWQMPDPHGAPDPGLTLIVTEGFGTQPMSAPCFDLLTSLDRQEALIEGVTQLRQPLRRPRVVVPLSRSAGGQLDAPSIALAPGVHVRLLDAQHLGQMAVVQSVPSLPRKVASGARVLAVEVALADRPAFFVPRTAVEPFA
ncbi:MAG: hypothetical protein H7Y32_16365 [Chloroflexales bacterium]|nr:hypothetical protein [Chloroflexales bacterium]